MKINFKTPTSWFYIIILTYSCYDYWEHISRKGSIFEAHPGAWLLFTVFSIATVLGIFYLVNRGLQSLLKQKGMLFGIIGLFVAISCHILLTGPLFNRWFWPHNELYFKFKFGPIFIILSIYFAFRMIWLLITKLISKQRLVNTGAKF
ncbi:MAG: hypothetical protein AAF705_10665 [Bacteroidota bacterium]